MRGNGRNRLSANQGNPQIVRRCLIGIGPQLPLQANAQDGLGFFLELVVGSAGLFGRPVIEQPERFPMQPVRGLVGSNVGFMSPDTPHFLAAQGLPNILSFPDRIGGE